MLNFSSLFLRKNKGLIFVALFFILGVFFVPSIANALSFEDGFSLLYIDIIFFISGIFDKYADIATWLLNKVIAKLLEKPITTSALAQTGWVMVRDMANMLIVLGFVIIGIATTLRIQEYQAKKLLPSLIIVALLINFSPLLIGIIIDASHFVMGELLGSGGLSGDFGIRIYLDILMPYLQLFVDAYSKLSQLEKSDFTIKIILFCFMFFLVGTTFFYYALIFIERYIMLLILTIISPLAFIAWIFPATRKYWKMWIEQLIKWAFIGIAGAFFINIAIELLSAYKSANVNVIPDNLLNDPDFYPLIMVCLLLFIGLKVTKKNSGVLASSVTGLAGAAVGMAAGYATAGGAFALKSMGATRVAANIKDTMTGGLERLGLVSKGTTASSQKKRLDEAKKRLENITDNKRLAEIAEQRAITHRQSLDKAAAADILAGRNAFGAVDASKRDAVAAHAAAFGVPKETFTKVRPETFAIAEHTEAVEKATIEQAKIHSAMTGQSMEKSLKTLKATNWKPSDDELRNAKIALEQRKITENALGISPVSDKDVTSRLIEEEQKAAIDAGATRAEAIEQTKNFVPNAGQIADAKDRIAQERIRKAVSKLSSAKIPDLPLEAINAQTIGAFSENQLKEGIARRGSGALLEKARKYGDPNTPEGKEFAAIRASTSDPLEQQRLADVFNILQTL